MTFKMFCSLSLLHYIHVPTARVNILAYSDPRGCGRNKQISENEEELKVFYCLALKNEEEMRKRWGNYM